MQTETLSSSPVMEAGYTRWLEQNRLPDWLIRWGIRRLVAGRLRDEGEGGPAEQARRLADLVEQLRRSPVALWPESANAQHYEVPAGFFELVLGPRMKYSCALWEDGAAELGRAEEAMLELSCRRARLEDGHEILELGCGWGSLTLYMAAKYPRSRILAVSNSGSQKRYIDGEAARLGLTNVEVVTADMNDFTTERRFERVVSVEMFEHMRNYEVLLGRIASWTRPGALLFVHVFAHRRFAYPYEVRGASDWMAQHFFSGGLMPSEELLLHFQDAFQVCDQWRVSGEHYRRTAEAWLANLDRRRDDVLALFGAIYGSGEELRWLVRWRVFFMACAEMFGFAMGREWGVSHYLFERAGGGRAGGGV